MRHLRRHGCILKREGTKHSLWLNPRNGIIEAIPRHTEIAKKLVIKITRRLEIPKPGKWGVERLGVGALQFFI